jgi:hypothetical protein
VKNPDPIRKTQRQQVLDSLLAADDGEVSSVALSQISLQYNARIKELRSLGFRIVSRTERKSGNVYGFFRLQRGLNAETSRATLRAADYPKVPASRALPDHSTPSLFGDLGRWRDPEERL